MRLDDLIDETIAAQTGDFVPSVLAEKLVAQVLETEPHTLREWLDVHATALLTARITHLLSGTRARTVRQARRRAFSEILDDAEALSHFAVVYEIDDEHTRRKVADMTGTDHGYVAEQYHLSGTHDLMLEAFHRAVAKKTGKRQTKDVFTEDTYQTLLRSILQPPTE